MHRLPLFVFYTFVSYHKTPNTEQKTPHNLEINNTFNRELLLLNIQQV